MTNSADVRKIIINTGIMLLEKGLVQGTGGNISCREAKKIMITPSGMDYRELLCEDIVTLDMEGSVINGKRKPSIERSMHLKIYSSREDINAVIHTHSVYATALAASRQPLLPITDNQVAVFGGTVPVADYAPIGSDALALNASEALGNGCGVLLANHGALCVGVNLEEALLRCEMLETFARIFILSKIAGGGIVLSDEDIRTEAADLRRRYGQI